MHSAFATRCMTLSSTSRWSILTVYTTIMTLAEGTCATLPRTTPRTTLHQMITATLAFRPLHMYRWTRFIMEQCNILFRVRNLYNRSLPCRNGQVRSRTLQKVAVRQPPYRYIGPSCHSPRQHLFRRSPRLQRRANLRIRRPHRGKH